MPQACLIALALYDSCWLSNGAIRTTGPDVQAQTQFQPNWHQPCGLDFQTFSASQCSYQSRRRFLTVIACCWPRPARNGSCLQLRLLIGLTLQHQQPFRYGRRACMGQKDSLVGMSQSTGGRNTGSWDHTNCQHRNCWRYPSHVLSSARLLHC